MRSEGAILGNRREVSSFTTGVDTGGGIIVAGSGAAAGEVIPGAGGRTVLVGAATTAMLPVRSPGKGLFTDSSSGSASAAGSGCIIGGATVTASARGAAAVEALTSSGCLLAT